jgi:hypothetical protein
LYAARCQCRRARENVLVRVSRRALRDIFDKVADSAARVLKLAEVCKDELRVARVVGHVHVAEGAAREVVGEVVEKAPVAAIARDAEHALLLRDLGLPPRVASVLGNDVVKHQLNAQ